MIQFYAPEIATNPVLPEADSQHCVRVLRMKPGDALEVVDGNGYRYRCRLVDAHSKHALVEVEERIECRLPWSSQITVAVAPTKHIDRMEWMVEKLVEVGVNRIIPLRCRYSERKELKEERLQKIAVSAMKQSLKAVLPEIWPMTPMADAVGTMASVSQRFIAYCDPEIPRRLLTSVYQPLGDAVIFIGPEGDFSQQEIRMALDAGFQPVSLGDNRLRTETAALYVCSTFHVIDQLKQQ